MRKVTIRETRETIIEIDDGPKPWRRLVKTALLAIVALLRIDSS
jgi:hypothetical protein